LKIIAVNKPKIKNKNQKIPISNKTDG
jgi:hypothetical protein